jgi:hypothetical protein
MYQYVQLSNVNVSGNATRLNLSTWIARINRICAGVNFGTGFCGAGGAGGMNGKLSVSSNWQLRRWFKYGWGESVGSSCWLHLVFLRDAS